MIFKQRLALIVVVLITLQNINVNTVCYIFMSNSNYTDFSEVKIEPQINQKTNQERILHICLWQTTWQR